MPLRLAKSNIKGSSMITNNDTPETISVQDMAYELAEYEYLHLPIHEILATYGPRDYNGSAFDVQEGKVDIQEAMDKAYDSLQKYWSCFSESYIRARYSNLMATLGGPYNEM